MKKKIIIVSCLAVLSLVACGTATETVNDNVVLETVENQILNDNVEVTITSTPTPVPTLTSTPIPTSTPTPTLTSTPIPTSTPTPTLTSTPIPTATVTPIPSENENTGEENENTGAENENTGEENTGNGEGISSNYTDGNRMDREEENAKVQEDIDKHTEELREESNKVAEEDKKNDNKSELDLSMFTEDDLKLVAEFAGISLDDLKHLSEDAFKELYTNWFISKSLNKYGGGNTGGSSSGNTGSSNKQDDEIYDPEADWGSLSDNPNIGVFDKSSWGDAPAGGM